MNDSIIELAQEPSLHPAPSPACLIPWPQKRARNGKIARLPRAERDMVNHMLFNNIPQNHRTKFRPAAFHLQNDVVKVEG